MSDSARKPRNHFVYSDGWMNDPLGVTYRDGLYHLFFQCVPGSRVWAPECRWGHAVSTDLLTWSERDIVLAPGDGDDGAWSGCITTIEGEDHLFYTAISVPDYTVGRVRRAVPSDRTWNEWNKAEVVAQLPEDVVALSFRDPFVLWDTQQSRWRMLMAASLANNESGAPDAAVVSFVSDAATEWEWDGVVASRSVLETEPIWTGSLWECPQLITVDGVQILMVSVWDKDTLYYVAYQEGELVDGMFQGSSPWKQLSFGNSIYATSSFSDSDKKPAIMSWLRGVEGDSWVGAQSLPSSLSWIDGTLRARPHRNAIDAGVVTEVADAESISGDGWSVSRQDGLVVVTAAGGSYSLECGQDTVWCGVDGPILEVWASGGILAVAVG